MANVSLWHVQEVGSHPEKETLIDQYCVYTFKSPGGDQVPAEILPLGYWLLKRSKFESRYLGSGLGVIRLSLAGPITQAKKKKKSLIPALSLKGIPSFNHSLLTLQIEVTVTQNPHLEMFGTL